MWLEVPGVPSGIVRFLYLPSLPSLRLLNPYVFSIFSTPLVGRDDQLGFCRAFLIFDMKERASGSIYNETMDGI